MRETLGRQRDSKDGNLWECGLAIVGKTPKGKKPQGRQLSIDRMTVSRSGKGNGERVDQDSEEERKAKRGWPKKLNFLGPWKAENLKDRPKGKGQRGSGESDKTARPSKLKTLKA